MAQNWDLPKLMPPTISRLCSARCMLLVMRTLLSQHNERQSVIKSKTTQKTREFHAVNVETLIFHQQFLLLSAESLIGEIKNDFQVSIIICASRRPAHRDQRVISIFPCICRKHQNTVYDVWRTPTKCSIFFSCVKALMKMLWKKDWMPKPEECVSSFNCAEQTVVLLE